MQALVAIWKSCWRVGAMKYRRDGPGSAGKGAAQFTGGELRNRKKDIRGFIPLGEQSIQSLAGPSGKILREAMPLQVHHHRADRDRQSRSGFVEYPGRKAMRDAVFSNQAPQP